MARIGARKNTTVRRVNIPALAAARYQVERAFGSGRCLLKQTMAKTAAIRAISPRKILLIIVKVAICAQ